MRQSAKNSWYSPRDRVSTPQKATILNNNLRINS